MYRSSKYRYITRDLNINPYSLQWHICNSGIKLLVVFMLEIFGE